MKLLSWLFGKSEKQRLEEYSRKQLQDLEERQRNAQVAASVNGTHYVNHVETMKQLKRENRNEEAIDLLRQCVDATEAESVVTDSGVAPWYYEQLAILYRKSKDYESEVAILERYHDQIAAAGVGSEKLAERLVKARAMVEKSSI